MTSSQSRPDSPEGAGALQHWRDRILNAVLWTLVIAGFFAWLPSTVLGLQQRLWWVVLVNNLGYALLLSIRFARRLPFRLRAGTITAVVYLIGLFFTVQFGPFAAGLLWLFAFPVLAAIFFGARPAVAALSLSALTLLSLGVALAGGRLAWPAVLPLGVWAVICGSFLALDSLLAISAGVLLEGLGSTAAKLEEQLAERARIEEQLRQASKMEALGRLAGGVAHDFNNILTVILGAAEMLAPRFPEGDPDAIEVSQIREAAERAVGLTRQFLAFSRRQMIRTRVLDLGEVVLGLEQMLRRLLRDNVVLHISIAPELGPVRGDPGQLGQVVLNLAINGADAMPAGGELTIELSAAVVDERFLEQRNLKPGRYLALTVRDTGVGMDPALQERIFEPFFTTKESGQGTGLGLSMVYGAVKQASGDIAVSSAPGQGSAFTIYLPEATEPRSKPPPKPGSAPLMPGKGEGILVLDDNDAIRQLVSRQLRTQGYTVHVAAEVEEAAFLAASHGATLKLLVSDVVMPRMNGPAVAALLRKTLPALRVLYMSGYTDEVFEPDRPLGSNEAFLQKPFTDRQLIEHVQRLLASPD